MIPRKMKIAFLAILASIGMMIGLAGPASAYTIGAPGSAAEATATSAFSMSGTKYVGAWVDDYPLPIGAAAVQGAPVTGKLFDKTGKLIATKSTTTAADGTYHIVGSFIWSLIILDGGWVEISNGGGIANDTGGTTRVVDLTTFEDKRVGGATGTSALPFNFAH